MTLTWVRALQPVQATLTNLAQTAADAVSNVFLQYGAIGVMALLGLAAVRVLFKREIEAHEYQRQRADRLEERLDRLNTAIQDRHVVALTEATKAVSEVLDREKRL